jgi:oligogalacturonide transporter
MVCILAIISAVVAGSASHIASVGFVVIIAVVLHNTIGLLGGYWGGQKVQAEGVSHTILMILSVGTILVLICGFLVSLRFKLNLQTHSTLREETAKMRETGRATPESATPEARATVEMLAGMPYECLWGNNNIGWRQKNEKPERRHCFALFGKPGAHQ